MKNILNYKFGFYLLIVVLIGIFVIDSIEEDYDDDEITKAQVKETISNFFSSIEIGSELDTYDYITEDFQLVELGGPYTLAEFWSIIESSQANSTLTNNISVLKVREENLTLAEEVYQNSQTKYKEGVGSSFEVTSAQTDLKTAQRAGRSASDKCL